MAALTSFELVDGVATITLDDGKVNAFSIAMLEAVHADIDRAEKDGAVVVIAGCTPEGKSIVALAEPAPKGSKRAKAAGGGGDGVQA